MKSSLHALASIKGHFYASAFLAAIYFWNSSTNRYLSVTALLFSVSFFYLGYLAMLKISPKGKAVLITGCDSGFGHQLALQLGEIDFKVFAGCLNDECEGALRLKKASEGKNAIHVLKLDVTKDDDVERAKQYVINNLKDAVLWGLVNNAGIGVTSGFVESKPTSLFEKVAAVNLFGTVRVTKAFLPFIRRNRGRIVNVSSVMGRYAVPANADYTISKFGIEAFSDTLRLELRRFGVKVCVIQPGNFLGATSILQHELGHDVRHFWDLMDDEAQADYGIQAQEWQEKLLLSLKSRSFPTTAPVVDAMTEALCRVHPRTHYFVARLSDKIGVHACEMLPAWIADHMYELMMRVKRWQFDRNNSNA